MASNLPNDVTLAENIDRQCDDYEQAFHSGRRPRLEDALADAAEPYRSHLFRSLLELKLELRRQAGEQPRPEEYVERFPQYANLIDSIFADLAHNAPLAGSSVKVSAADTSQGPVRLPSAAESAPPTHIGRFEIVQQLGEGAFGMVYRAKDPQLDREVAIKVPRVGALATTDDRERFLREARAAAGLQHANICPVYEVGAAEGRDYIVMGYIEGKPLSQLLQSGSKFTAKQVAAAIRKLALALEEAHAKGVIHRDLKPANIMINRKGEPVIMDFGLARRRGPTDALLSHSGQIMGTPAYMSPEQARGDSKVVGPPSDIFSLGVVMFELLCGKRPFSGTVTEVIGKILHVEPPTPSSFRSDVDPQLEAICLKALAKQPEQRFGSMKELASALTAYLKSGPASVPTSQTAAIPLEPDEPLQTNQLAKLMAAVSADLESKVQRAVKSSGPPRVPWLPIALSTGGMGLVLLLAIVFFFQGQTVKVSVTLDIDVHDPQLGFFLDGKNVTGDSLLQPIELTPGPHELIVMKDNAVYRKYELVAVKGRESAEVVVKETVPEPKKTVAQPVPASPIPADATVFRGHSYKFFPELLAWKVAKAKCEELGGHLIVIDDREENTFAAELVTRAGWRDSWIGATDEAKEGDWRTVHGDPLPFTNWFQRQKQPNNKPPGEHYAVLSNAQLRDGPIGWEWSDQPNHVLPTHKPGYLCEWPTMAASTTSINSDRTAAEWVLGLKGTVTILYLGRERRVSQAADLPTEPFKVVEASLLGVKDEAINSGLKSLRGLSALRVVDLMNTAANDRGVQELAGMTGVTFLSLHDCPITDECLATVRTLVGLEKLWLHYCPLTDAGITKLDTLQNLKELQIPRSKITAQGLKSLAKLPKLEVLGLNDVPIDDEELRELLPLRNLQYLSLMGTQIKGPGLRHLQPLNKLTRLDIGSNYSTGASPLTDEGLVAAAELPALTILVAGDQQNGSLTDAGVAALAKAARLQELTLPIQRLTDVGLASLGQLQSLTMLAVVSPLITDAGLEPLQRLENLWLLRLHGERITDASLPTLAGIRRLRNLDLTTCRVTGSGIKHLAKLAQLETLNLNQTLLDDEGLKSLSELKSLRFLTAYDTRVTDRGLEFLYPMKSLRELNLSNCAVTNARLLSLSKALPECSISPKPTPAWTEDLQQDTSGTTAQVVALLDHLGAKYEREINHPHQPLMRVDASGTKLNDDGLAQFAGQDKLVSLNLAHTAVTEAGLVHLHKVPNLDWLELRTSDAGLAELARVTSLKRLGVIAWSPITDAGLAHLKDLKNLEELNVSYNEITSKGLEHLRSLPRLNHLCLNATKVDDTGLAVMKDIKTLEVLWLGGCPVTDAGLAHLRGHQKLKALIVGNEHVTDATIRQLRTLPRLDLLFIGTAKLTDACLDDLTAIKTLRNLDLSGTQITPAGLARLREALPECSILPADKAE